MNPKWLQVMMLLTMIVVLTSSCTKYLNNVKPWTTVMKAMVKHDGKDK